MLMSRLDSDLHQSIHKALRKRSAEFLIALGQTDFTDADVRSRVVEDANKLLRMLARHDLHEEAFMHPFVALASDAIATRLDAEHGGHADMVSEAKRCLDLLLHGPRRDVQQHGHALYLAFGRVIASDMLHMDFEERCVQPNLETSFDDDALRTIDAGLLSPASLEELMEMLQAILLSVNSADGARAVECVRKTLPAELASDLVPCIVRPMLKPKQYTRLLLALDSMTAAIVQ